MIFYNLNKSNIFIILFVVMVSIEVQGGEFVGSPVDVNISVRLQGSRFHIYEPPYRATRIYENIKEIKNNTPEELMHSIFSESSQEWVDFNNEKGKSHIVSLEAFKKRKGINVEKNYFELIHKLYFSYGGVEYAMIKYWFVDNGQRTLVTSATLKHDGKRWLRSGIPGLEKLQAIITRLKPEVLKDLLYASGSKTVSKDLFDSTRGSYGVLDVDKLFGYISELAKKKEFKSLIEIIDKNNNL